MTEPTINVFVRNLNGQHWREQWTKDKLAYLILMSDLDEPKFDRSLDVEWVPYDVNLYRWDKANLSREEFAAMAARWPGGEPATFNPHDCDYVRFRCETPREVLGIGFNPAKEHRLFSTLCHLVTDGLRYEGFQFAYGRHVFVSQLSRKRRESLLTAGKDIRLALHRVGPVLVPALEHAQTAEVRFQCRAGTFQPPFQFWFKT